jgi:hypothetical protein
MARAVAAVRAPGVVKGGVEPRVRDEASGASVPVTCVPQGASTAQAFVALLEAVANVKIGCYGTDKLRLVTHHQVGAADLGGVGLLVVDSRGARLVG